MKLKHLKTLLSRSSQFLLVLFLFSCKDSCDEKFLKIIDHVRNNNYDEVKKYMESGKSATESCYDYKGGKFGSSTSLINKCIQFEKLDLLKLILNYENNLDNYSKSEILRIALNEKDKVFVYKLVNKYNAHIYINGHNEFLKIEKLKILKEANYNFNYTDPFGNTLLIDIIQHSKLEEKKLLKIVKYLIEVGVKTNIKNNNGKTAYDVAVNKNVKEFLKDYR
ncbi:ankyrin repeat domain-containing protein [Mesonia oceanica]|uniref:Uncharacterized protein n=2 Tax=Mesonia TaxID=232115 RepID=A0AC61Y435_9FLAO|nr:ankyrin repeat domain-containing protein [Mesonia oceanica]MAQ42494.1 hypothetical protein [Mesonia sp.]MBJ96798.1 hypothetical protein [Flavobacteriaceae bacterium]VVU99220.1 hypothetical protein FVB9532_00472 [Mesonia oceanica]